MQSLGTLTLGCAAAVIATLPHYEPRPVEFPKDAGYVTSDGAIAVIGYNDMQGILEAIDRLFIASHPGFKFSLVLKGTKTAAPALTRGSSAFAPMGAEFLDADLEAYRKAVGADPVMFRVAHDSVDPRALSSPIAVFVNKDNPLEMLTTAQVAGIFTRGQAAGDLANWGQVGLGEEWAGKPIHPIGLGADTALSILMRRHQFGGHPYAENLTVFHQSRDVVEGVGRDPIAIGFAALFRATPRVKILAIDRMDGSPPSRGSPEDIMAGKYAYDRHLLIYVRRPPGQPYDSFVHEYLRLVLSREGQAAIAADSLHYLPLNASEAAQELAKLEH